MIHKNYLPKDQYDRLTREEKRKLNEQRRNANVNASNAQTPKHDMVREESSIKNSVIIVAPDESSTTSTLPTLRSIFASQSISSGNGGTMYNDSDGTKYSVRKLNNIRVITHTHAITSHSAYGLVDSD